MDEDQPESEGWREGVIGEEEEDGEESDAWEAGNYLNDCRDKEE